jgi:hypothetical protein
VPERSSVSRSNKRDIIDCSKAKISQNEISALPLDEFSHKGPSSKKHSNVLHTIHAVKFNMHKAKVIIWRIYPLRRLRDSRSIESRCMSKFVARKRGTCKQKNFKVASVQRRMLDVGLPYHHKTENGDGKATE